MTRTEPADPIRMPSDALLDTQAAAESQQTAGYCHRCGAWTVGQFVRAIDANSGPGVDIVTHGLGTCPGPRRR